MNPGLRDRRVGNELRLLEQLERLNEPVLEVLGHQSLAGDDLVRFTLNQTAGMIKSGRGMLLTRSHCAEILLPRLFPAVPIEAKLKVPVFHPNVDPLSGFVCLWNRYSPGDTIMDAIRQLQQIIPWNLVNLATEHLMQPEAVQWYSNPRRLEKLPLDFTPIVESEEFRLEKSFGQRQRRQPRRRLD